MKRQVEIAVKTDVGRVRSENQDHFCVFNPEEQEALRVRGALVTVADGMGGHTGGTVASHTAVDAMYAAFVGGPTQRPMRAMLEEAILAANQAVRDMAEANPQMSDMGTTCVSLMVRGSNVVVGHLGDSRCYLFRRGEIDVVTRDHTYLNELVDIGLLTPEQAKGHPDKNIITRCVGMNNNLDIDFNHRAIEVGDAYLLCSDGLTNFVSAEEMLEAVTSSPPEEACTRLIALANERGGDDNITVAILKVNEIPESDAELAALDVVENFSANQTPVIDRRDLGSDITGGGDVDADADTASDLPRPHPSLMRTSSAKAGAIDGRTTLQGAVVLEETETQKIVGAEVERRPSAFWYWLIGVEIVILVLLQILIRTQSS